jgi:deoxyribose-phosphate aldolase
VKISMHDVARLIDASALKIDTSMKDVQALIDACKKYDFIAAFVWPVFSKVLGDGLKGTMTRLGTPLSFPSGQEPTRIKVMQAEYFVEIGAAEIDMVMNIGFLKSGFHDKVREDIAAVKKAAGATPLKVIVEAMLLNDDELVTACRIVMECGADFVKSGTGFSANPTTLHHVELMKRTIGNTIKLKVAGGVRNLSTLLSMYVLGADRFGIGLASSISIMEEARAFKDGITLPSP